MQNEEKHLENKEMFKIQQFRSLIDLNKVAKPSNVCIQPCDLPYSVAVNVHNSEACVLSLLKIVH